MVENKHHFEKQIISLPRSNPWGPFCSCLFELQPLAHENWPSPGKEEEWNQGSWGKGQAERPALCTWAGQAGWGGGALPHGELWTHRPCLFHCHLAKQNSKERHLGRKGADLPPLNSNGFLWGRAWEHCEEKQRHIATLMSVASDRKLQMVHYLEKNCFNKRMHSYISFHNKNPNVTFCSQA